MGLVV